MAPVDGAYEPITLELRTPCGPTWARGLYLLSGSVSSRLTVVGLAGGAIASVDFSERAVEERVLPRSESVDEGIASTDGLVAGTSISEDGHTVAVAFRDGNAWILDAHSVGSRMDPIAVPVVTANDLSYIPSLHSPVALDAAGKRLAVLGESGAIDILELLPSGETERLQTLPYPLVPEDGPWGINSGPAPMAVQFVEDGVVVSYARGLARFASGELPDRDTDSLPTVRVTRSDRGVVGEIFTLVAEAEGLPGSHLLWVERESYGWYGSRVDGSFELLLHEAGYHRVRVIVDDGFRTGFVDHVVHAVAP